MLAQFGVMAVLARTLDPAAFGLMAMAAIATRFASFFAQAGAAQTLVQAPALDRGLCTAALVVTLAVSGALYGITLMAAPLFGSYFTAPQLVPVLTWFGLSLPLAAAGSLPMAVLRRQGRFKAASAVDVVGYTLGYGVTGTTLALRGHGVWSLVAATLCQQGLVLLLSYALARYPLGLHVPREAWRRVLGQGSRYSLIGFLEFLWANVETLLMGRWLGQAVLGLYNRAQLLCNLPVEQAVNAATKVLFPALSAMQSDRARLTDGFLLLVAALGVLSSALSAGISAAAADVVALLLGPRWAGAVPVVALLAASVPAMFCYVACGITLDSLAALGPKLRLQAVLLPLKVLAVLIGSSQGLQGVVLAIVLCEWLRAAAGLVMLARLLDLRPAQLRGVLVAVAAVAATSYAAVALAQYVAVTLHWPVALRVVAEAVCGLAALLMLAALAAGHWSAFGPLQRFESLRQRVAHVQRLLAPKSSRA